MGGCIVGVAFLGLSAVGYTHDAVRDCPARNHPDSEAADYTFDGHHRMSTATDWLSGRTSDARGNAGKRTTTTFLDVIARASDRNAGPNERRWRAIVLDWRVGSLDPLP